MYKNIPLSLFCGAAIAGKQFAHLQAAAAGEKQTYSGLFQEIPTYT